MKKCCSVVLENQAFHQQEQQKKTVPEELTKSLLVTSLTCMGTGCPLYQCRPLLAGACRRPAWPGSRRAGAARRRTCSPGTQGRTLPSRRGRRSGEVGFSDTTMKTDVIILCNVFFVKGTGLTWKILSTFATP